VDQFTRECVAIQGKPRLNGSDVAEALDMAVRERGKPASITVDNVSEFAGKVMDAWADAGLCTPPSSGQGDVLPTSIPRMVRVLG
jgi:hypothetical protein